MDGEAKTTDTARTYGGGYPGSFSTSRFLLDPDPDPSAVGGAGGAGEVGDRARPQIDLSGISAADLAAVPDIHGGETDPTPASAPVTTPPATAPVPTDPNVAANRQAPPATPPAGTQPATTQTQTQAPGIRDAAQFYGVQIPANITDDAQAFAYLTNLARRGSANEYYAQLGQSLAPHHQDIQAFLAQRQQAAAAPARPAWQPPEFNEAWLTVVDRDPQTGVWKAKPGYDPQIAVKVNAYQEWQNGFQRNPVQTINAAVEERAAAIADERINARFAQHQQQTAVQGILDRNAPWLYATNEQGQRYVDGLGRPVPSQAGARYQHHVADLGRSGVTDPLALDRLAIQLVRSEGLLQAPGTQAAAATTSPATTAAQLTRPNVNAAQVIDPAARVQAPAATPADTQGKSLYELLKADMAAAGVTDDDVVRSFTDRS